MALTPEEHHRVAELFAEAVDLPNEARESFIERIRADEPSAVIEELVALLAADGALASGSVESLFSVEDAGPLRAGPYRLLRKLGEGGMSQVFLAVRDDGELYRRAAVKLIRREILTPEIVRRFETERQILASLDHPSIARIFDAGRTDDGVPFFVMEHIEGEPIDRYCEGRRLTLGERLELFREVCSAVSYAHQNLVVHRDIKPSNLLVTEPGQPKLLDFGIAKVLQPELLAQGSEPTAWWDRRLTPDYASPEQLTGKTITTASDVYSLGVLLFKLLTGELPFALSGRTPTEVERLILTVEPPKPSSIEPDPERQGRIRERIDGDLDAIVAVALRKEPQRRYGSVAELDRDLERYLEGRPVAARRGDRRYRLGKLLRRHRLGLGVAAAFLALVMAAVWALSVQSTRLAEQRERAMAITSFIQPLLEITDSHRPRSETITTRRLLDSAMQRIETELAEQPETQADLLSSMGRVYLDLRLYEPARRALEQSLETRQALSGANDERLAESLAMLGFLETEVGRFAAAEDLQRRVLAIRERTFGLDHEEVAQTLLDLSAVLVHQGRMAEAESLGRDVLTRAAGSPGRPLDLEARALSTIGQAVWAQGRAREAEIALREAVGLQQRLYGESSREVAQTFNNLALAMRDQGRIDEAEALLEDATEIASIVLGDLHVIRAVILNNLATLAAAREDHATAVALYGESFNLAANLLPSGFISLTYPQLGLGASLCRVGELAEGEELIRAALARRRRFFSPDHPQTRRAERELEHCLQSRERGDLQGTPPAAAHGEAPAQDEGLLTALVPRAAGWCVPDGGFDDTLTRYSCCSGVAVHNTTACTDPEDWGTTWESCNHICGTRPVGGCIPSGGIDDTLHDTDCCSGKAIPGSTRCLDIADYGTTWRTCVHTCA